ncbi:class D sortase [Geobacillus sp. G4]|uniref:class D sortase n=1 Tax=Geobacillus TaxID=129337 RepID=UPI0009ADB581|nr:MULTISPECIES: class D sortase [Geobacillus]MBW7642766.1 class D sortase [Geobacillus thermoleovorans]OPX03899.1 class D sortase [Geobacillus sp. LEMMY01]WMJ18655.1 class D sortase [Geobacillus kaustophilus]
MNRKRLVRFFGASLIAAGIAAVGISALKWKSGLEAVKPLAAETKRSVDAAPIQIQDPLYPKLPKIGEQIGELIIPKLNMSLAIYHGTDENELEKGVGHYAGSVLPGEADNCVLSGHRDTVFRRLGEVGQGDILIVRTSAGTFTYKVRKVRIVDADDRTVIVPKPKATLTVSTCYPFRYVGPAPQRYVLVANLINDRS